MLMACLDDPELSALARSPILLFTPVTNEGEIHDAIEKHVADTSERHRASCVPWSVDGPNPHLTEYEETRLRCQYEDKAYLVDLLERQAEEDDVIGRDLQRPSPTG